MTLTRFRYSNGLDIIAPLKHGTRWLEEKTNPLSFKTNLHIRGEIEGITKETYWVYREPRKHLVSALRTEIRTAIEFDKDDTDSIMDDFINGMGSHWHPELYKYVYSYWNNINFNLIHLNDLSNLFPGIEYDSTQYDMPYYFKAKHTTEDIIELIGSTKMNEFYTICDENELWLKRMLNNEKGLSTYDVFLHQEKIILNLNTEIQNQIKVISSLNDEVLNQKKVISFLKDEISNQTKVVKKKLI
jgi:hypothetical protein